jgi:hypothetical protein
MTNNLTAIQKEAIKVVVALNPQINAENLTTLVAILSTIGGCSFMSIRGYNSAKSDFSEIADYRINVGAAYDRMKEKTSLAIDDVTFEQYLAGIETYNYAKNHSIAEPLVEYKKKLNDKELFENCKIEMMFPKEKKTDNNIWLVPKILVFNTNTLNLCIFAQNMEKVVKVESTKVPPKPKTPATVCKRIISHVCEGSRTKTITQFNVGLIKSLKARGTELEIDNRLEVAETA